MYGSGMGYLRVWVRQNSNGIQVRASVVVFSGLELTLSRISVIEVLR
jgi:hypothetical protein